MSELSQNFPKQYAAALESYLAGAGETALRSAYELGRQALEFESGVLGVAAAHHEALRAILLREGTSEEKSQRIKRAADFFSECISPFEMSHRGFQDSITALRGLNETLQHQKRDLDLLLSPMPNLLITVDKQDHVAAFFVPPRFPRILGACEVGMAFAKVLPAELHVHVMKGLPEVRQNGQLYRLECPLTVDGQTLYFELQITPVTDSSEVLLVIDNITERRQIAIAEREQRVLAEALRDTAIALNSSLNLNEVLNRIVASISPVVPHDTANIMLIEGKVSRVVRSFGYAKYGLSAYEKFIAELVIGSDLTPMLHKIVETKQAYIVDDLINHPASSMGLTGSAVSAPILVDNAVIGFINLQSFQTHFFTRVHGENLQIFAYQAAAAIENAHLYEQAQEVAALNERQRLARELHDALNQSLFAASVITESLLDVGKRRPDKVFPLITELQQLIKSIMAEMRVLLWELRPANVVSTPLDKLFTQLISAIQARTKVAINCTVEGEAPVPEDVHIAFYRIGQEAINNIVKHSNATEAHLYLSSTSEQTILRIRDNGRGFNLEGSSSGYGLGNMRERAQSIGGVIVVTSQQEAGTEIAVTWKAPPTDKPASE